MKEERERKREKGGRERGGTHNTKAMVADCSDNGLSSSEGLRGGGGGGYKPSGFYLQTPPLWVGKWGG